MTGPDDDLDDMSWVEDAGFRRVPVAPPACSDDAMAEAAMTRFVAEMRALGDGPAPEPSPELAAMLVDSAPHTRFQPRRTRYRSLRRTILPYAAAAAVATGLTGVAAAHDSLPQPAQRVVSRVVNVLTPMHIDPSRPAGPIPPHPSRIAPEPSDEPGAMGPEPPTGSQPVPVPEPEPVLEPNDDAPRGSLPGTAPVERTGAAEDHSGGADNGADGTAPPVAIATGGAQPQRGADVAQASAAETESASGD